MIFRVGLMTAACAGFLMLSQAAEAQYGGYSGGGGPGYGGPGYGDDHAAHCARMQERLHEVRYRMQYAAPYERERMAARAEDLRDRLRAECWRH